MHQTTPKEFGLVRWRGGAGKPGELGGWGFDCNFCRHGDVLQALPRRPTADKLLGQHVLEKHINLTAVQNVLGNKEN